MIFFFSQMKYLPYNYTALYTYYPDTAQRNEKKLGNAVFLYFVQTDLELKESYAFCFKRFFFKKRDTALTQNSKTKAKNLSKYVSGRK